MALPPSAIVVLGLTASALWGVGSWALVRSLRDEERKLALLDRQETIETYSPRGLTALGDWIVDHPDHPRVDDAIDAYNDCLDRLERIDATFYDWGETQIDELERF